MHACDPQCLGPPLRLVVPQACRFRLLPAAESSHRPPLNPALPIEQVLRLWEALWAGPPGLHLYLCVAVLMQHRRTILRQAGCAAAGCRRGRSACREGLAGQAVLACAVPGGLQDAARRHGCHIHRRPPCPRAVTTGTLMRCCSGAWASGGRAAVSTAHPSPHPRKRVHNLRQLSTGQVGPAPRAPNALVSSFLANCRCSHKLKLESLLCDAERLAEAAGAAGREVLAGLECGSAGG